MCKMRKRCVALSLMLVLSFFLAAPAFAADLINTISVNGFGDSGDLMVSWNVDGIPYDPVDMGKLTVSLQRYSSYWSTIKTKIVTEYNTTCVDNNYDNYTVPAAGTYRLKTVFYVEDGDETDTYTFYSSSRYVD